MSERKSAADAHATQGFATRAIHAGSEPDPLTGAVNVPIYASSTFAQDGVGGLTVQGVVVVGQLALGPCVGNLLDQYDNVCHGSSSTSCIGFAHLTDG